MPFAKPAMRRRFVLTIVAIALLSGSTAARQGGAADPIKAASDAIGASGIQTLRVTAFGAAYSVGQGPSPAGPWPRGTLRNYELLMNYETPAMQLETLVGDERRQQFLSGMIAWNVTFGPKGAEPPQPVAAQAERAQLMLLATPHAFLRAAAANKAAARPAAGGTEVTFTANGRKFAGVITANNQLARAQTWIEGDVPVEATYSNYQKFDVISFPMRIVQRTGAHPSLELWISSVTANPTNPAVTIVVPDALKPADASSPPG
jgi:hypothetical protein